MSTKTPAPTKDLKSMLRNPFGIALVAYYLLMAIVGMLVPDDILRSYTWAREFSDFMAGIVPQIDRVTALNIKPDVNRFYFSVLWAGSPMMVVIVFGGVFSSIRQKTSPLLKKSFKQFAFPMMVVAATCIAAWFVTWLVDPSVRLSKVAFGSQIGRGLIASSLAMGPQFFGPIIISWSVGWLTGYIPRNIEKNRMAETHRSLHDE